MTANLLVRGGLVITEAGTERRDLLIVNGRFSEGPRPQEAPLPDMEVLDAKGQLVFPGLIDPQVHFRDPGFPDKEDLGSGSLSAIAGGVTSFMEMPNTKPPTTDPDRLRDKLATAAEKSWADHAFFLGATPDNAALLGEWEHSPGCAGVKVFMGSSTGNLLLDDPKDLETVLRSGTRRVAVHSEDEERLVQRLTELSPTDVAEHPNWRDVETALRSTRRLLDLAEKTHRKVHLLHVSTAEEIDLLRERDLGDLVTSEVTIHHLFLTAPDCYRTHGSNAQMNPPIREARHRDVLRQAVADGTITCIGSDHAPHTSADKARPYPRSPSGIPGVQTTLPMLLLAVEQGWLRQPDIPRITSRGPARVYGIRDKGSLEPGAAGDLVVVDPAPQTLTRDLLRSRAGYSPYEGLEIPGWPSATILRGRVVYSDLEPQGQPAGKPLQFAP